MPMTFKSIGVPNCSGQSFRNCLMVSSLLNKTALSDRRSDSSIRPVRWSTVLHNCNRHPHHSLHQTQFIVRVNVESECNNTTKEMKSTAPRNKCFAVIYLAAKNKAIYHSKNVFRQVKAD